MRWHHALLLCLWLVATPLSAQTVTVRSGEHGSFTRLTIPLPDGVTWSLEQSGRLARLRLDGGDVTFGLDRIFDRIGRNRLTEIRVDGSDGRLELRLACRCVVNGRLADGSLLVLDIRPGEPPDRPDPLRLPLSFDMAGLAGLHDPDAPNPGDDGSPGPASPIASRSAPAISAQDRLLSQIRRAVRQDLLNAMPNPPDRSAVSSRPELAGDGDHLAVITAIDRDMQGASLRGPGSSAADICLPEDSLAIETWGGDAPFEQQVGPLRARLFREFDRADPETARTLARLYLHFGFGAEAATVLELLPDARDRDKALVSLAHLLDRRPEPPGLSLRDQAACRTVAAMWAVLAGGDSPPAELDQDAVLRGFARLPKHLRPEIGPRLAEALVRAGRTEAASTVLRAVRRTVPGSPPPVAMAEAELAAAIGNPDMRRDKLVRVLDAQSDPQEAPRALLALVETAWTERSGLAAETVALAAAFAAELRHTELGAELRQAHLLALALSGEFDPAFEALAADDRLDPEDVRVTRNRLVTLTAESADDITFLTHVLADLTPRPGALDPQTIDRIGARLLKIGFADEAFAILDTPFEVTASDTRRLLRAEAAISSGRPNRALLDLLDHPDDTATALRARALMAIGNLEEAGAQARAAGLVDLAAQAAWQDDRWTAMPPNAPESYRTATELARALDRPPPPGPYARLSDARALLEDSNGARERIDALLSVIE
ncbi:hypothetical protein SAMN05444007_111147 [Cribrihabitans marinus]|uniref:HEAT repeat domain-containing protein n=1 Tax=Cribrihabitans marinus TaxID=1227549 RepID=A0A1H7DHK8_9RHOB|nr:hypothetical protein [Cribrihabitans marinus]GGH39430.1 hypothetical protein GCM10010973_35290 [Cribrihabitans marinus]SEK01311.1 hypothetical protein SAMN05444007_111147 [Cribrihabitans marinus]